MPISKPLPTVDALRQDATAVRHFLKHLSDGEALPETTEELLALLDALVGVPTVAGSIHKQLTAVAVAGRQ